jgi:hypothetical protein
LISIFPVVYAQATRLLNTISHRSLGLAPNTVDGRMQTTENLSDCISFNAFSASHFVLAYDVIAFLTLLSSSSSASVSDMPYMLWDDE